MRHFFASLLLVSLVLATAMPLPAHHAIAAKFDTAKPVTLKGTVTVVDWANPHVHVFVNVPEGIGMTNWAVELESPVDLQRGGWTRTTLKPGDAITVQGISARDGSKQAWGNSVVMDDGGKRVFVLGAQPVRQAQQTRPTPRWPDGQPRLGALPGEHGYWGNPSATVLVQTGSNVPYDSDGLLRNLADVDKVAPFQRWARDLFELRQRSFLKDDPIYLYCMPPGGPRQFQLPYGVQFLEERDNKRIFLTIGGGNHNWTLIHLDGRARKDDDKDFPTYYGRSIGRWENDTLVVDARDFNERFWFSSGGLPHTQELRLTERISRPDFNTLRYEVTIEDPGAYTRPWSSAWTLQWVPGEELPPYYCQDNRP
jgi:Family of unknown function (DUF6152)